MAYCSNCGTPSDGRFCRMCGTVIAAAGIPHANRAAPAVAVPQAAPAAAMTENVAGTLCYAAGMLTGILFLLLQPYGSNPRIRFHAFQAILFHLAFFGLAMASMVAGMFLPWMLDLALTAVMIVLWFGGFLLWIYVMYRAYQNQPLELPVVGAIARQQAGAR
ncbi:MAG: DUF4870 domain-containing protein [Bryobacteraceae bacterium]